MFSDLVIVKPSLTPKSIVFFTIQRKEQSQLSWALRMNWVSNLSVWSCDMYKEGMGEKSGKTR